MLNKVGKKFVLRELKANGEIVKSEITINKGSISGCSFAEDEIIENATVQILKCTRCGERSIGWSRTK